MFSSKKEIFNIVHLFQQNELHMDAQKLWEHDDVLDALDNAFDTLITHFTFLTTIDQSTREACIGKLTMNRILLSYYSEMDKKDEFMRCARELEKGIRAVLASGTWLSEAQLNYDAYQAIDLEEEETSEEKLQHIRPFLLLISAVDLITTGEFFEEEDDEDDEDACEEECDDQCEEECNDTLDECC